MAWPPLSEGFQVSLKNIRLKWRACQGMETRRDREKIIAFKPGASTMPMMIRENLRTACQGGSTAEWINFIT
jgi:hypothetical protein